MGISEAALSELRFADVLAFLAVCRHQSVTGAARELRSTPSQVSKAISRLEEQLRLTLLSRSSRGVVVSDQGRRVLPHLEEVVERLRAMPRHEQPATQRLTVAAPSYLMQLLLPRIAASQDDLLVRGIELPPALIRAYSAENFFDLALTVGRERLPGAWVSEPIGEVRRALFGTREVAKRLGRQPVPVEKLAQVPFVSPIYNVSGQFVPVDDDCPLPSGERVLGHQAPSIGIGLELAACSHQVVFGPVIAARRHLAQGLLVEIDVAGWDVREPLYVACNSDRVRSTVQKRVLEVLRATLREDPA
ncbi:MAG TPA: LysR family transcriptional regulator [Polyangia bacterium]|nr:LysR family transcriptional regulator [Polyangia bacterium]